MYMAHIDTDGTRRLGNTSKKAIDNNKIIGRPVLTASQLYEYVKAFNPNFEDLYEIAENYISVGKKYGVRGDIAFCQAVLETGWFKFGNGTAVTPDQHNYCGMGVVRKGLPGNSFATIKDGVTAHIQHLYAYASTENLPKGEQIIDPRFKYVSRGSATTWKNLGEGKWCGDKKYGEKILSIYNKVV